MPHLFWIDKKKRRGNTKKKRRRIANIHYRRVAALILPWIEWHNSGRIKWRCTMSSDVWGMSAYRKKKITKIRYKCDPLDIWPQLYIYFRLHVQFDFQQAESIHLCTHTHGHYVYLLRPLRCIKIECVHGKPITYLMANDDDNNASISRSLFPRSIRALLLLLSFNTFHFHRLTLTAQRTPRVLYFWLFSSRFVQFDCLRLLFVLNSER